MKLRLAGKFGLFLLLVMVGGAVVPVHGQSPALPPILEELRGMGCLPDKDSEIVSQFPEGAPRPLTPLNRKLVRNDLNLLATGYRCLLENADEARETGRPVPSLSQPGRFGEMLLSYYRAYPDADLCLADRLTRSLANLQYFLDSGVYKDPNSSYQKTLDQALSELQLTVAVAREIKAPPAGRERLTQGLAERWCVNRTDPVFSTIYIRGLLESAVDLSIVDSGNGSYIGTILQSVLADTRFLFSEADPSDPISDLSHLLSYGRSDFSSAAKFYRFEEKLDRIVRESAAVNSTEVADQLLASSDTTTPIPMRVKSAGNPLTLAESLVDRIPSDSVVPRDIRDAIDLLGDDKSRTRMYFAVYSDHLFDVADSLRSSLDFDRQKDRRWLMILASKALYRGIELSSSSATAADLESAREEFRNKVLAYGQELAADVDFEGLISFESQFLDESTRVLPDNVQCYFHAHLAQAFSILGSVRESDEHQRVSCDPSKDERLSLREFFRPSISEVR